MPTQLQLRRGTTTEHSTFSGAVGEVTVDTTKDTLIVHDGATNGGFPLAKEAGATFGNTNVTGDFSFADNAKAQFGAGSDLQIYHDGADSFVKEIGTGNLNLASNGTGVHIVNDTDNETMATFHKNGASTLYYDNSAKIATTATGVDAINTTGSSTSRFGSTYNTGANDGTLVIGNGGSGDAMLRFDYEGTNTDRARIGVTSSGQQLEFYTAGNNERMRITSGGNVGIGTSVPASPTGFGTGGILHLKGSTGNDASIVLEGLSGSGGRQEIGISSGALQFYRGAATGSMTESMRIDSSGRVGIGTTSPYSYGKLTVEGGNGTQLVLDNAGEQYTQMYFLNNGTDKGSIWVDNSLSLFSFVARSGMEMNFYANNSEAIRINSSGNVGIGTSSPSHKLNVRGGRSVFQANSDLYSIQVEGASGAGQYYIGATNEASPSLVFSNVGGTESLRITSAGNVGIGTSSPSQKLTINGDGGSFANTAAISFWDGNSGGSRRWSIANGASATGVSQIGALTFNVGSGTLNDDPLSSGTEVMRMTAGGVVGIGVTSPTNSLDTAGKIRVRDGGNTTLPSIQLGASGVDGLSLPATNTLAFITNSTERMRIDSSGNLLVASTANVGTGDHKVSIQKNTAGRCLGLGTTLTSATIMMSLVNGNGTVGSIQTNGSSTSYVTSSDYRLKTAVTYDWDATSRLKQLKPARFAWIADADTTVDGFLAHEVQEVVPEAISGTHNGMRDEEYEVTPAVLDEDGNEVTPAVMGTRSVPDYQGIDQSKLVPLLVKTIQELEARIAALEAN